jgi:hypothetical protein
VKRETSGQPGRNPADVPILLLAWRRPHTLRQVIDAIRPLAPTKLFVACDGAGNHSDNLVEKVAATRRVVLEAIDWPCELQTLFSESNLGCSKGPIQALNWFFSHVEEGIILEDDCVPHLDFFSFSSVLLDRFRDDERVWCISGDNFQDGQWRGEASYYFSRYPLCWGWATWRRCWQHYDPSILSWPALRDSQLLLDLFADDLELRYWTKIWEATFQRAPNITWWDYQWTFACISNGALTAIPNRNLITNIGVGHDSTHFSGVSSLNPEFSRLGLTDLVHPLFILRDAFADRYTFEHHFLDASSKLLGLFLPRMKARILNNPLFAKMHS